MGPNAPFEVIAQGDIRVFKHAPENMAAVFDQARRFGEAEFIVSGHRRLTYDDFFKAADALSAQLVGEHNISAGTSIAISMQNSPEWMMAFVAILNAGGVAVLINSRATGRTMSQAIEDADSVLIIADEKRAMKLREVGCDLPIILPADFSGEHTEFKSIARRSDDLAAMFFTSGTTGTAKAAAIQHRALITGMMNTQLAMAAVFAKMAAAYGIDVETLRSQMPQGCSLLVFPLFHTSGCSAVFLTALTTGGKLVLMERWDADKALALIEGEKITALGGVPTMHWDLLRSPNFAKHDLSSLMSISCGGQALPLNLLSEIRSAFPKAYIGAGYGMTETCGAISQANGEAFLANPSASGHILPMVDVQIMGESGEVLPVGETGEIWAKGATLMQGYYGRPKDTAASMSGPWFKTGDIGRLDNDGYIYIVDRKTDMVISGGENIYCAEVEQILGQYPHVLQLTTFGVADDRLGERLVLSARLKPEGTLESLQAFAKDNLAPYKVPSNFILRETPYELNAMGKIEKYKVREAYLETKHKEQAA